MPSLRERADEAEKERTRLMVILEDRDSSLQKLTEARDCSVRELEEAVRCQAEAKAREEAVGLEHARQCRSRQVGPLVLM
jgi:hypothetical protein